MNASSRDRSLPPDKCPPVFVVGGAWNALAIVRGLSSVNIDAVCVVPDQALHFAARTRFAHRRFTVPDPASAPREFGDALLELATRYDTKPVLMFTEDAALFRVGERDEEFRERFRLPQSPWDLMQGVFNKRALYALAEQNNIPFPRTQGFASITEMLAVVATLPIPCIVKPEITVAFLASLPEELRAETHHPTRGLFSASEIERWGEAMVKGGLDVPVVVQEYIPGGAETLHTLTSYSDASGKMVVGSVGHKVRQFPPDAGCITSGRLQHEEAVFEQGKQLLEVIGYHGLANTEFKYDARDGSYRLMEINPRLGKWCSSAYAAGLNMPAIAYHDCLDRPYIGPSMSTAADGTLWIDLLGDAMDCIIRARTSGYPQGQLSLGQWLRSIRGRRIEAIWQWNDPLPGFAYVGAVFAQSFEFVKNRLKRPASKKR